jgi:DNA-binding NtrC family response regulator
MQGIRTISGLMSICALSGRDAEMRSTHQVFVVDDEPLIARTLAAILTDFGYDAIFFTDPLIALEVAAHQSPAFLVSDVTMPGLTGIELAMEVRKRSPNCNIFLMSALDCIEAEVKKAGAKAHEFKIFRKPFSPHDLLDAMAN